jgi:biopolymer transport protein TolQ
MNPSESMLSLVTQSSIVVQGVLMMLIGFSVITWVTIVFKYLMFKNAGRNTRQFLDVFWGSRSLDSIFAESKKFTVSPISRLFQSGYTELQKLVEFKKLQESRKGKPNEAEDAWKYELSGIDNVMRALSKTTASEQTRFERMIPFLATAGSTAPFIGLFGTVWGILNSFRGIGQTGSASLAVVAPGIAEALIATAVGLAAAIPAVMAYNYFLVRMKTMRVEMESFTSDFLNIVKRNFFAD